MSTHQESLNIDELFFLVALNATEEASISELSAELADYEFNKVDLDNVFDELIRTEVLGVMRRNRCTVIDLEMTQAREELANFPNREEHEISLFLTKKGFDRWESNDWNLAKSRVQQLMFRNNSGSARIK